jgi:hypothetical protein
MGYVGVSDGYLDLAMGNEYQMYKVNNLIE